MKIVQLTPGSGDNFYCENCLRDAALFRAMRTLGADVVLLPMYLPIRAEKDTFLTESPVFFGGVNVFLQQKFSIFRKTPRWLDKVFDSPALLRVVGRFSGMTSAKQLGETTLSMLRGQHGRQSKELERLIDWLEMDQNRPDVVVLSNVLLAGLAQRLKQRLPVSVVSMLQDEDGFLDGLGVPYAQKCWDELTACCEHVDLFISVSDYYAHLMRERLSLDKSKVKTVYTGLCLEDFDFSPSAQAVPTIGFLSRLCPAKGLDVLVEAFILLKKEQPFANARLKISGGKTSADRAFIEKVRDRLCGAGVSLDVEFLDEFRDVARIDFLRQLSVLCVPERHPVAYGLYALEAMAASVPVVAPADGVFVELAEMTSGIVAYDKHTPQAVANALKSVLGYSHCARTLAEDGRNAVFEKFDVKKTAVKLLDIYLHLPRQTELKG